MFLGVWWICGLWLVFCISGFWMVAWLWGFGNLVGFAFIIVGFGGTPEFCLGSCLAFGFGFCDSGFLDLVVCFSFVGWRRCWCFDSFLLVGLCFV